MIIYENTGYHRLVNLLLTRGSVFPRALVIAIPAALWTMLLRVAIERGQIPSLESEDAVMTETQAWSGFSFLVGFLIVFRTNMAYNRFWDGCTSTHAMRAEWFDAASSLVAFCKHSKEPTEKIDRFKHILVRLFSMLHAAALAEIEDEENEERCLSLTFDLIDAWGIDEQSMRTIQDSDARVELIFEWIQMLVVDNIATGVLSIPPPILSRAFQEVANGMVQFHEAFKISTIPFPFPYAQTCDCLLVIHWIIVPFVTSAWVSRPIWAAIFTFVQVFILWALNFIACEIENPFGQDPNDLSGGTLQDEMNKQLLLLLKPTTQRTPELSPEWNPNPGECSCEDLTAKKSTFKAIWQELEERRKLARAASEATEACLDEKPSFSVFIKEGMAKAAGQKYNIPRRQKERRPSYRSKRKKRRHSQGGGNRTSTSCSSERSVDSDATPASEGSRRPSWCTDMSPTPSRGTSSSGSSSDARDLRSTGPGSPRLDVDYIGRNRSCRRDRSNLDSALVKVKVFDDPEKPSHPNPKTLADTYAFAIEIPQALPPDPWLTETTDLGSPHGASTVVGPDRSGSLREFAKVVLDSNSTVPHSARVPEQMPMPQLPQALPQLQELQDSIPLQRSHRSSPPAFGWHAEGSTARGDEVCILSPQTTTGSCLGEKHTT